MPGTWQGLSETQLSEAIIFPKEEGLPCFFQGSFPRLAMLGQLYKNASPSCDDVNLPPWVGVGLS